MNFRRNQQRPNKSWNKQQPKRQQKSFLKSLTFFGVPAALIGGFVAVGLNLYAPDAPISHQVRQLTGIEAPPSAREGSFNSASDNAPRNRARLAGPPDIVCRNPRVTDGDTLRCGETRIRLEGIDSPEMAGKCRPGRQCVEGDPDAAKANLQALVSRGPLECTQSDTDHYGRMIARCVVDHVDLSCEQVRSGHAEYRYARIDCD